MRHWKLYTYVYVLCSTWGSGTAGWPPPCPSPPRSGRHPRAGNPGEFLQLPVHITERVSKSHKKYEKNISLISLLCYKYLDEPGQQAGCDDEGWPAAVLRLYSLHGRARGTKVIVNIMYTSSWLAAVFRLQAVDWQREYMLYLTF